MRQRPHAAGDSVRVHLPNPEASLRWYPSAFAANGREGTVTEIRSEDCTRKLLVQLGDGSELELSEDCLVKRGEATP